MQTFASSQREGLGGRPGRGSSLPPTSVALGVALGGGGREPGNGKGLKIRIDASGPIEALNESLFTREMPALAGGEVILIPPRRQTKTERHERKMEKGRGEDRHEAKKDR